MRLFLDACVLFPTATREILLGYAAAGGFAPLWSERVIEEWTRAAAEKLPAEDGLRAAGDAALLRANFPEGGVTGWEDLEAQILPPDPADAHVIAAASIGGADGIVTFNTRDFPLRLLGQYGIARLHPDAFLAAAWESDRDRLAPALAPLAALAAARDMPLRRFLKRAALPRLGKAWERDSL